jgi:uncharacterized protein
MALPEPTPSSTAIVTGASSGIGREIARGLAERGHGVTLVARRADRLEELATELRAGHDVHVEVIPADLAEADQRERVVREVAERGLTVEVLVNNAGFGVYAPFATAGVDKELQQVEVLVTAVIHLSALVVPGMRERGRGAIINLSSTSAFQALPGNGTYAAAKSFVLLHSEALSAELKPHGITVTAVCPGPVKTEFQETSEPLFADRIPKPVWASAERVAEDALSAAEKGKRTVIPGGLPVKAAFGMNRVTPSFITLPVSRMLFAKELERG